jgi:hypothetical protein
MIADGVELGFYSPRDALESTYHREARSSRAATTRRAICLASTARRGGRSCPDAGASRSKSPLCLSDRDSNSPRLQCCCINLSLGLLLKLAVVCWPRGRNLHCRGHYWRTSECPLYRGTLRRFEATNFSLG